MNVKYSKEEIIKMLQELYEKYNKPITWNMISKELEMPNRGVFKRLFGSWQNACKESGILYGKELNNNHSSRYNNRTGEEKIDNTGTIMKIIKYEGAHDIIVEFQDEFKYKLHTSYSNWNKNRCKNPYAKTIYNKACIGNAISKVNGIKKDSYKVWYAMLQRCYRECYDKKPTYLQCEVCDEWLCFENFEKWYDKNFYQIKNEKMHLDKDILVQGNKMYSPDTCVFVPQKINVLFISTRRDKNQLLPRGIVQLKNGTFKVSYSNNKKIIELGIYDTMEEAFNVYKTNKEKHIKEVADFYKDYIPEQLYKAMYNYEIKIDY